MMPHTCGYLHLNRLKFEKVRCEEISQLRVVLTPALPQSPDRENMEKRGARGFPRSACAATCGGPGPERQAQCGGAEPGDTALRAAVRLWTRGSGPAHRPQPHCPVVVVSLVEVSGPPCALGEGTAGAPGAGSLCPTNVWDRLSGPSSAVRAAFSSWPAGPAPLSRAGWPHTRGSVLQMESSLRSSVLSKALRTMKTGTITV